MILMIEPVLKQQMTNGTPRVIYEVWGYSKFLCLKFRNSYHPYCCALSKEEAQTFITKYREAERELARNS